MTILRKSLLVTVSVLILLSIGLLFIVPNNKENPENKTVAVKNKFNPPIINVQNVEYKKMFFK
ncbi:hypothetical protein B5V88_16705 [Heyndrickxia sporothermodurans]|nr:hypothetical protein B5V88_16705 [Heyndrickxia sporothermodurans]PTY82167.1 hypothetical protein B5V90_20505 [Heyndrickxia sporothermodurans]PTY83691.1 hypothetical protein B5V91_15925 [Heyndrickxia sporothermodurans]